MDRKELESALEAILFASGEPVQVDRTIHISQYQDYTTQ